MKKTRMRRRSANVFSTKLYLQTLPHTEDAEVCDALVLVALLEAEAEDELWLVAEEEAAVLDTVALSPAEVVPLKVGGSPAAPLVPGIRSPSPGARFLIMRFREIWSRATRW